MSDPTEPVDRSIHGTLGSDNDPQFVLVPFDELTPSQQAQVLAIDAEIEAKKRAVPAPDSLPHPSDQRGER